MGVGHPTYFIYHYITLPLVNYRWLSIFVMCILIVIETANLLTYLDLTQVLIEKIPCETHSSIG